jgi:hypothetical protein
MPPADVSSTVFYRGVRKRRMTYTLRLRMTMDLRAELIRVVAARLLDLRAELEAQLRAVVRLEEDLGKAANRKGEDGRRFDDALRRALTEMLTNNKSIRDVLTELTKDAQSRASI